MTATISATALLRLALGLGHGLVLVFTVLHHLVRLAAMTTMVGEAVKVIIAIVVGEQGIAVIVAQRRVWRV